MRDRGSTERRDRGLVIAWRRWQLGLLIAGAVLGVSLTDGAFLEIGAGADGRPRGLLAEGTHGAPVWSIAFAGPGRLVSATTCGEVRLKDLPAGRDFRLLESSPCFTLV